MPLVFQKRLPAKSNLGLWQLTEAIETLEQVYPLLPVENNYYSKLKNDRRKKEWLATRILLTELLGKRVEIKHTEHGKPYIINSNTNISISHSRHFVSILLSNAMTPGIDIEHISERVQKVEHKFLDNMELQWCESLKSKTICWSAKEAIFKTYEKELDFHDIQIQKFDTDDDYLMANVIKPGKERTFKVYIDQIENDVLTYTYTT